MRASAELRCERLEFDSRSEMQTKRDPRLRVGDSTCATPQPRPRTTGRVSIVGGRASSGEYEVNYERAMPSRLIRIGRSGHALTRAYGWRSPTVSDLSLNRYRALCSTLSLGLASRPRSPFQPRFTR